MTAAACPDRRRQGAHIPSTLPKGRQMRKAKEKTDAGCPADAETGQGHLQSTTELQQKNGKTKTHVRFQ